MTHGIVLHQIISFFIPSRCIRCSIWRWDKNEVAMWTTRCNHSSLMQKFMFYYDCCCALKCFTTWNGNDGAEKCNEMRISWEQHLLIRHSLDLSLFLQLFLLDSRWNSSIEIESVSDCRWSINVLVGISRGNFFSLAKIKNLKILNWRSRSAFSTPDIIATVDYSFQLITDQSSSSPAIVPLGQVHQNVLLSFLLRSQYHRTAFPSPMIKSRYLNLFKRASAYCLSSVMLRHHLITSLPSGISTMCLWATHKNCYRRKTL